MDTVEKIKIATKTKKSISIRFQTTYELEINQTITIVDNSGWFSDDGPRFFVTKVAAIPSDENMPSDTGVIYFITAEHQYQEGKIPALSLESYIKFGLAKPL